jgi:hypothetical protein
MRWESSSPFSSRPNGEMKPRGHFQRPTGEQGVRQQRVDFGKSVVRETEERQVAKEHGIPEMKRKVPDLKRRRDLRRLRRGPASQAWASGSGAVVATAQRHEVEQGGVGQLRGRWPARAICSMRPGWSFPTASASGRPGGAAGSPGCRTVAGNDRELARLA